MPVKDDSSNEKQNLTSEEFILSFNWPEQIFYFLNEELANLNRQLISGLNQRNEDNESNTQLKDVYYRILSLLKCCFILSKYLEIKLL